MPKNPEIKRCPICGRYILTKAMPNHSKSHTKSKKQEVVEEEEDDE